MQKIILSLTFLSINFLLSAQAYEDKIEFSKNKQDCLAMDFAYPTTAVENAFLLRMEQLGYKGKEEKGLFNKDKGFRVYKEATLSEITAGKFDYIIYVDKKSKRSDNESVLYLLIMKDNVNALSYISKDVIKNAKEFLVGLVPDVEAADLELQITAQENLVKETEKKLAGLKNDKEDMEKKIKNLQDDIKDNEKKQENQAKEIEDQKKTLEELQAKRKKLNN